MQIFKVLKQQKEGLKLMTDSIGQGTQQLAIMRSEIAYLGPTASLTAS